MRKGNEFMKKTRLIALVMVLLLALTQAYAQAPQKAVVLATVNGEEITKAEADGLIPVLVNVQFIADASDYKATVDFLVRQKTLEKKIKDMGFDQFSPEELTAFGQEARSRWDEALAKYADYVQAEDTEEAKAQAMEQAKAYYASQNLSYDGLLTSVRNSAALDKMTGYLMGGYQPTEEEILEVFNQVGPAYQQQYENDIPTYEFMTRYSGQTGWYTPTGYRGIIHILLTGDVELVNQVRALEVAYEEQQQEKAEPENSAVPAETQQPKEPVTLEMIEAARQKVLESKADVIKEINDRLAKGESFENLIKEFGEDPGMTNPDNLENGYPVHQNSVIWDPAFVKGAFSEKMKQVGDVSDPVVGSHGIHILKYLRDVPSGLIMTDAIHDEISQYLIGKKQNEVFAQAFDGWMKEMDVVYNQQAIDQAAQEAAAMQQQSVEELPPEAVSARDEEAQPGTTEAVEKP
jgi:hypothetical protein